MADAPFLRRKRLDVLLAEAAGEQRLHRVLGVVTLTSLGVGAIIGAGIFAMTGRVAAEDAGPGIMLSFVVAAIGCSLAALCYSEFAAMVPVAGSAYTYTYATLGELAAWIIGWDLILEYAMSCAVVAAHWTKYLNAFLKSIFHCELPLAITSDPFSAIEGHPEMTAIVNLPAMLIIAVITVILVIGIKESAVTNTALVILKLGVVLFVICLGAGFVSVKNWTTVPVESRRFSDVSDFLKRSPDIEKKLDLSKVGHLTTGEDLLKQQPEAFADLPEAERHKIRGLNSEGKKWGLLSMLGLRSRLQPLDDSVRSPFLPFGISGVMMGAALVFFAYIGFDSISTHSEEAVNPQRDVPIAILVSLGSCTLLYILVAAVITGMVPYPQIDPDAAVATAFHEKGEEHGNWLLKISAGFIACGALAGMTSVLLVTFLSQARIFLAMARDGLLPHSIFGVVHPRFRTPHRSTILTGVVIALAAGFSPIRVLEEMVSIGTLMAFALVCASVLLLRVRQPQAHRPFQCPLVWIVAPLGVAVNVLMMLFLPLETWTRLVVWLVLGLVFYLAYGMRHSELGKPQAAETTP